MKETSADGTPSLTPKERAELQLLRAQRDKLKAETARINAGESQLASWLRAITSAVGVLSVSGGILGASIAACSTLRSIDLAQQQEARLRGAAAAEIESKSAADRRAREAEIRLKDAAATEADIRVLSAYTDEVLPRLAGAGSSHVSEGCFDAAVLKGADGLKASELCTAWASMPRATQQAAYWAAADMANRYPILCRATRAALQDQGDDAAEPVAALRPCPLGRGEH